MEKHVLVKPDEFQHSIYQNFVIVAKINEQNIHVAIMGIINKKQYKIILRHIYPMVNSIKIADLLNECLKEAHDHYKIEVNRCVVAASGPIPRRREYIKLTNIDYTVTQAEILNGTLLSKVILINDFEAVGYGINILDMQEDVLLLPHVGEDLTKNGNFMNSFAVAGAGNGLGVSIAYYDRSKHMHQPTPSEGGHMEFTPHDALELEFAEYLKSNVLVKKDAHPEYERVVSRHGMSNIYNFLRQKNLFSETHITKNIDALSEDDKIESIRENPEDPTCKKTIDLFLKFYARAAKNIALISECYSGLFLCGSLALQFMTHFYTGEFMKEFEMHDIRSDVLRKTPVYIIQNRDVALLGCVNVAMNFYNLTDK